METIIYNEQIYTCIYIYKLLLFNTKYTIYTLSKTLCILRMHV